MIARMLGMLVLLALVGCGDDDQSTAEPTGPSRDTPERLLESWLVHAFVTRDTAMYVEGLDAEFNMLSNTRECTVALLRSEAVADVALSVIVLENTAYVGDGCEDCRWLTAEVGLRLVEYPLGEEAADTLAADTEQFFACRREPSDEQAWVIVQQAVNVQDVFEWTTILCEYW